ncbi:MAG TPA: site-specific integrase [Opitutaceae bacterium]|nr:site-specific integrase [Opitutaceae bacterium]
MNQTPEFLISEFTNPSGEIVFRVSGWLDGKRIRKNFPTRAEAKAELQSLEIDAAQDQTGLRRTVTRLTEAQLREAEAVFLRLAGKPHSLTFCADFTLTNYRAPDRAKLLTDALTAYIAAKKREQERGIISAVQVASIKKELALLETHFCGTSITGVTTAKLIAFCERGCPSLKTYNNRRGILGTFFKFAFQQDWIVANLIEKIPYHRIAHRRGSAKALGAAQAAELMEFVENYESGRLVPYFGLCLFAGIRPCLRNGEILKLRPEQVCLETGVIHIEPEVSKVRMKRNVTIQPNLAAWLQAYPLEKFPIVPPNLQRLRAAVAKKFGLSKDIMRHTFISMFVAKFRSMGEAALQAGNSESIIRKHYLDLKSPAEAEEFFSILPKHAAPATAQFTVLPAHGTAARRQVRPAA